MTRIESDNVSQFSLELLRKNTRPTIIDGQKHEILSALPEYVDQFLWDSAFMAIALSHTNPQLAQTQVDLMSSRQKPNGFQPIINFYEKMSLAKRLFYAPYYDGQTPLITQPPFLAIAQEKITQVLPDPEHLALILPRLAKNIDYLITNRDPDCDGLVSVIHPWELGIDLTPSGDRYLRFRSSRPNLATAYLKMFSLFHQYKKLNWQEDAVLDSYHYHLENVLFNVITSQASQSIANLYRYLGDKVRANHYNHVANVIKEAILKHCWNESAQTFYDLDHQNKQIPVTTIASISPLFLDDLPTKYSQALVKQLLDPAKFWSPYPIPSVAMDEPTFNHSLTRVLWRGQTFVNTNWIIYQGLRKNNHPDIAAQLGQKTIDMVVQNQPYEFFNPLIGKGGGMANLGWDSLIVDMSA